MLRALEAAKGVLGGNIAMGIFNSHLEEKISENLWSKVSTGRSQDEGNCKKM